jgi:hypothetical protein
MEYVKVTYPTKRSVRVDEVLAGKTGDVLELDEGTHVFDLGNPPDYDPSSQEVVVSGTTVLRPMVVDFTRRGE